MNLLFPLVERAVQRVIGDLHDDEFFEMLDGGGARLYLDVDTGQVDLSIGLPDCTASHVRADLAARGRNCIHVPVCWPYLIPHRDDWIGWGDLHEEFATDVATDLAYAVWDLATDLH